MPTHFRSGVSNAQGSGDLYWDFGRLDPTTYVEFFDDFIEAYDVTNGWTVTKTEAGSGSATAILSAAAATPGGVLLVTNDDADDDNYFAQRKGEAFRWDSTKHLWFRARFKLSDATDSDFVIGLQITDTTPLDVTDGFFFIKADNAATIQMRVEKNDTAGTLTAGTCVSATWHTVGFHYDPRDGIFHVFFDGTEVGTVANTNAVDDEDLTVSFGIQNGAAAIKTLQLDYIHACQER
jgi:hypothetical protein